jgi:uncharacterized membrane protein YhaH (DUF805 family)
MQNNTNPFRTFTPTRINRTQFWLGSSLVWCLLGLFKSGGFDTPIFGWFITCIFAIALIALCRNRLHDIGKSSYWLLMLCIPIIGAAWLVWQLALKRGQSDSNRWGPSTKASTDFLKVA